MLQLTWYKNGHRIVPSQKYQTTYSNEQATLKITQTTTSDSGHYTLLAENPQGELYHYISWIMSQ